MQSEVRPVTQRIHHREETVLLLIYHVNLVIFTLNATNANVYAVSSNSHKLLSTTKKKKKN